MFKHTFANPTVSGLSALYAGTFLSGAWFFKLATETIGRYRN